MFESFHIGCTFKGDVAVITLPKPWPVDAGIFTGQSITGLPLTLREGKLHSVGLKLKAGTAHTLIAPAPKE